MGIIRAVLASAESLAADQWKEFFVCDSIPAGLIMVRGVRHQSAHSANHGDPDVISDGSLIALADGQSAIVVSGGKVIAVFKEPGENTVMSGSSPSIFAGATLKQLGNEIGRRVSFGGDVPGIIQRVYYINTKIIPGIEFGNGKGIPFRIVDEARGLDIDCTLVAYGVYAFRVCDPEKIYKQMMGNVSKDYRTSFLVSQMRSEVDTILMTALGSLGVPVRPGRIGEILPEIEIRVKRAANEALREARGIEMVSLAFTRFTLTENDSGLIREIQRNAVFGAAPEIREEPLGETDGAGKKSRRLTVLRYCPECGVRVTGGKFCRECGFRFPENALYEKVYYPEET